MCSIYTLETQKQTKKSQTKDTAKQPHLIQFTCTAIQNCQIPIIHGFLNILERRPPTKRERKKKEACLVTDNVKTTHYHFHKLYRMWRKVIVHFGPSEYSLKGRRPQQSFTQTNQRLQKRRRRRKRRKPYRPFRFRRSGKLVSWSARRLRLMNISDSTVTSHSE